MKGIDLDADARAAGGGRRAERRRHIPGTNDCGPIVHDDPILAEGEVQFLGQPVFAVIATTREAARRAAAQGQVEC